MKDAIGARFGRLLILDTFPGSDHHGRAKCVCDCGRVGVYRINNMRKGDTTSCGCFHLEATRRALTKHGAAKKNQVSKTWHVWQRMKQRCQNPRNAAFDRYGGRGIKVCKRWINFKSFLLDMGDKPEGLSLDRIDNNLGYTPGNCRWATPTEQARNTRRSLFVKYSGRLMPLPEASIISGIKGGTLRQRIAKGMSMADVFSPVKPKRLKPI